MKNRDMKSKLVDQWAKGGGDVVRVELSQYRGHDMVGVRVWRPCSCGDDKPLKNGISLTVKHLPKLIRALRRARKKAVEAGLLPKTQPLMSPTRALVDSQGARGHDEVDQEAARRT